MGPVGVFDSSILDRLPLDTIEYEDDPHHTRGNPSPANNPIEVWFKPGHLFDTSGKLFYAKDPSNGNGLNIIFHYIYVTKIFNPKNTKKYPISGTISHI